MPISSTRLSCSLRKKVYGTEPIGGAFDPDISPASTPHHPTTSVFLFLYILCLRSCRLPSVFIRRPCLPSLPEELRNSWVPSLPGGYPSSSLLQTLPPPSRLPSFSWFSRLWVGPAPEYFSLGRVRFLQLRNMPLSPYCPYHPAGMSCRLGQPAPRHVAFIRREKTRLPDLSFFFEATSGFTFVAAR